MLKWAEDFYMSPYILKESNCKMSNYEKTEHFSIPNILQDETENFSRKLRIAANKFATKSEKYKILFMIFWFWTDKCCLILKNSLYGLIFWLI